MKQMVLSMKMFYMDTDSFTFSFALGWELQDVLWLRVHDESYNTTEFHFIVAWNALHGDI